MEILLSFSDFMLIRRGVVNPEWTNWAQVARYVGLGTATIDRLVAKTDPFNDRTRRDIKSKNLLAMALDFDGWWDMATAWRNGHHPSELPRRLVNDAPGKKHRKRKSRRTS